jgi:outer membrane protein
MAASIGAFSFAAVSPAQSAEPPSAPQPAGANAPAVAAGPSKVAVVAFDAAVVSTNEGQRAIQQIQAKYAPKGAALKTENDQIEALKKEIQDKGSTLTDAERDARVKAIDDKTKDLNRQAQDAQNDENSEMQDALTALSQKVGAVLEAYAQQNGFTVVLDGTPPQQNSGSSQVVLWVAPGTDITKAVIDAYNTKSGVPAPATTSAPAPAASHPATHSSTTHSSTTHPATSPK